MNTTIPIYLIYKITCTITDKSYIGQTSMPLEKRWDQHKKSKYNYHFPNAIKKHGEENFIREILFSTHNQNTINEAEIAMIAKYDTFNNGYNMTIGGEGIRKGFKHSKKSRQKMSEARKGKKLSKETKLKLSIINSGKNNPNYRIPKSDEIKKKMSISKLGRKNYQYKGNYHTPYGIFESSRLASTELIGQNAIRKWCKYSDKIITKASIGHSPYLQQLPESPLGKTFKELRFWFEHIQ